MALAAALVIAFALWSPGFSWASRASASEACVVTARPVDPIAQADPGSVLTVVLALENRGAETVEVGINPELPESWSLLVADEAVRLAPGECDALPISISIPRDALSGTYEVPVVVSYTRLAGSVQSATAVFTVRINEVRKVKVSLVKAPEYVTDTAYTVSFLLTNQGNVIENLELVAREIQGAVVKPSPARVSVRPGAGAVADVHVRLQSVPGKVLDHTVFITAESRDSQLARASASARVKVLPQKLSDSDAYHHLPVRIELSAAARAAAGGAGLKITGEGPVAYGSKDRLRLSIADSSGAVEYRAHGMRLLWGDAKFSLSPLTEWGVEGQGVGVEVNREKTGFEAYAHDRAGSSRMGFKATATPTADSQASVQLLTQDEPSMNVITVRGWRKLAGAGEVECEYGLLTNGTGENAQQALRAEAKTRLGPVEASAVLLTSDPGYSAVSNPGRDLSLKLRSVSTRPVATSLLLQEHEDQAARSRKLEATAVWTQDASQLGLKYSDATSRRIDSSDCSRVQEATASLNVSGTGGSSLKQELTVQRRSAATADATAADEAANWKATYTIKHTMGRSGWKLESYITAGVLLTESPGVRLSAGLCGSYKPEPRWELKGGIRSDDIAGGALIVSGGATFRVTDSVAFAADASCKVAGGQAGDFAMKLTQTVFFDLPLARRADVGEIAGRVQGLGGQGIAGVMVSVDGLSAITDSSGAFRFPSVVQGKRYVSVAVSRLGPEYSVMPSSVMSVQVEPNQTSTVSFTVAKSGRITGVVRFTAGGEPHNAEGGEVLGRIAEEISLRRAPKLLSGLLVELSGPRRLVAQLDSNGQFSFDHLPPGEYRLVIDRSSMPELYELIPSAIKVNLGEGHVALAEFVVEQVVREYDFTEGGEIADEPAVLVGQQKR